MMDGARTGLCCRAASDSSCWAAAQEQPRSTSMLYSTVLAPVCSSCSHRKALSRCHAPCRTAATPS